MIPGGSPLGATPLSSLFPSVFTSTGALSSTGTITFDGSAPWHSLNRIVASGGATFGSNSNAFLWGYAYATLEGLAFDGAASASQAKSIVSTVTITFGSRSRYGAMYLHAPFASVPERFTFMAERQPLEAFALPELFVTRAQHEPAHFDAVPTAFVFSFER